MAAETSPTGFAGLRVAGFESRLSEQMAQLIERHGGQPLVVPSMREIPLDRHPAVLDFGARLLAGELQMTILLTGVGTRFMLEVLKSRWTRDQIIAALDDTILVVRGPKPAGVLRELGLKPAVAVPEPNTWKDVIAALDALDRPLQGMKIAVQEYGVSNAAFLKALHERGAEVLRVPVYRWALPEDVTPLIDAIRAITRGELQVAQGGQVQRLRGDATTSVVLWGGWWFRRSAPSWRKDFGITVCPWIFNPRIPRWASM